MKISGPILKSLVKKLGAADAPAIVVDTTQGSLSAAGPDLTLVAFASVLREEPGRIAAIDQRQFSSITSRLTGEVEFNLGEQALEIVTSKSRFQLALSKGLPPFLPVSSEGIEYSLCPLKRILSHAASAAESRQRFSFEGSVQVSAVAVESALVGKLIISAAGTDGKRLAVAQELFDKASGASFILPVAAVTAIGTLEGETVRITDNESMLVFATGDLVSGQLIIAKKLARQFPDFLHLMTRTSKFRASVPATPLAEALESLAPIVAGDDLKKVELNFAGEVLQLRACVSGSTAEETVDYTQQVPDPILDGPVPMRISLNHKFLSEFAGAVKDGAIEFAIDTTTDPVLLRAGHRSLLVATVR